MGVFPGMPPTAKKHQHVAVIFGKLSHWQGESPKKTVTPGSNSFHRICWDCWSRKRSSPLSSHGRKQKKPSVDFDNLGMWKKLCLKSIVFLVYFQQLAWHKRRSVKWVQWICAACRKHLHVQMKRRQTVLYREANFTFWEILSCSFILLILNFHLSCAPLNVTIEILSPLHIYLPVDQGQSSGTGSVGSRSTGSAGLESADDILGGTAFPKRILWWSATSLFHVVLDMGHYTTNWISACYVVNTTYLNGNHHVFWWQHEKNRKPSTSKKKRKWILSRSWVSLSVNSFLVLWQYLKTIETGLWETQMQYLKFASIL